MSELELYGLKNCDSCKKAVALITAQGHTVQFHDFKSAAPGRTQVEAWLDQVGAAVLLNRAGTTWRGLSPVEQDAANGAGLTDLLVAKPSLIKRPVVDGPGGLLVGLKALEKWLAA